MATGAPTRLTDAHGGRRCRCPECGELCRGLWGLGSHRRRAHGIAGRWAERDAKERAARRASNRAEPTPGQIEAAREARQHRALWTAAAARARVPIRPDIHARFAKVLAAAIARPLVSGITPGVPTPWRSVPLSRPRRRPVEPVPPVEVIEDSAVDLDAEREVRAGIACFGEG